MELEPLLLSAFLIRCLSCPINAPPKAFLASPVEDRRGCSWCCRGSDDAPAARFKCRMDRIICARRPAPPPPPEIGAEAGRDDADVSRIGFGREGFSTSGLSPMSALSQSLCLVMIAMLTRLR